MKTLKNKKILSAMAILMILSFAASMIAVPNAAAQSEITTYPFVDALPNPAGVGQPVLINWGLLNFLNNYYDGWNVTLQITHPNDKVENITAKTWSTGTVGRKISFMEPGNYTIQALYDGEYYGTGNARRWYKPSESELVTLEVIEGYWKPTHPGHSLPNEYWTRPVDSQLREWYQLLGSWVCPNGQVTISRGNSLYAPYNDAPESAHILWSMPIGDNSLGGLAGADLGPIGYQNGDAYDGRFSGALIVGGVLFYNRYPSTGTSVAGSTANNLSIQEIVAVELRTGKVLWEKNFAAEGLPARTGNGQVLSFISENNRGAFAYLWLTSGTTMYAINPINGNVDLTFTNVPSGTIYFGPSGEMLKYSITGNATVGFRLTQWNSTHVVVQGKEGSQSEAWGTQVHGRSYNAGARGYDINVSLPGLTSSPGSIIAAFPGDRLCYATTMNINTGCTLTGINLDGEDSTIGSILYNRGWQAPSAWADGNITIGGVGQAGWSAASNDPYLAVFTTKENRVSYGFSLENGRPLWETEPRIYADAWSDTVTSFGPDQIIAYGKLYHASVGGIVYCYNATTGAIIWEYAAKDKYTESYHTENWWLSPLFISSGKIYLGHITHSGQVPISRGAPFFALDCETGEVVWEIDGAFRQTRWGGRAIIGDSIIATMDTYDQQIYAIGKGPSEMTVSAPNVAITAGTTALITGTVMDVSPGTQSEKMRLRFPNGVPAVGDESMSDWMLYVYKNFEQPMTVTGIEITVYAWDGNEVIDIGTTVSDARGRFSIPWTPESAGEYDIWAYFEGTAGFYGSDAKAEMYVAAAPEIVEPDPTPPYEWYIVGMGIAILAVVIVFGILSLRKK